MALLSPPLACSYVPIDSETGVGIRYSISSEDSIGTEVASPLNGSVPDEFLRSSTQAWRDFHDTTALVWWSQYNVSNELTGDDFIKLRKDKQLSMPVLKRITSIYLNAAGSVISDFRSGSKIFVIVAVSANIEDISGKETY